MPAIRCLLQLPTIRSLLSDANYKMPTVRCLLLDAYYQMPTTRCQLSDAYYWMSTIRCLLSDANYQKPYRMPTTRCLRCLLSEANHQMPTIKCLLLCQLSYWSMVILFWCHTGVAAKTLFPNMAVLWNLCHQNLISSYLQNADKM